MHLALLSALSVSVRVSVSIYKSIFAHSLKPSHSRELFASFYFFFFNFSFFLSIMICTVFYMFVWVTQERVVRNKVVDSKGVDSAPGLVSGF